MSRTQPSSRTLQVANIFGTLGYMSVGLQWFWTLLLLCYPLIMSDYVLLMPRETQAPVHIDNSISTSPIVIFIAACVTVAVLVLAVIAIIRLPKQIGQQGARITQQAATIVMPAVTHLKPLPKKKQRTLTFRIKTTIKLCGIVMPFVLLAWVSSSVPLEAAVIWTIGLFCASWSIFYIAIQLTIAAITKLPKDKLW